MTIVPPMSRRVLSASNPSSGRIAATGGTFAARRAGMITDASVMPTPTRNANRIVRGSSTVALLGKPAPAELKIEISPLGHEHAADDAEHGGDDRHDQRLEVDQAADLACRGPRRPASSPARGGVGRS